MNLERQFDVAFAAALALREKQIQQNYRPLIGIHKWFARRPGTLFRNLLLAEFNGQEPIASSYWRGHELRGLIADPFMGGGTTVFEANRLGLSIIGSDINPMAYWIVKQGLGPLDTERFRAAAEAVSRRVEQQVGDLYRTRCVRCRRAAIVKYFLWVKIETCPLCQADNDLFPGYLVAEAVRHPRHVVACASCGDLNEYRTLPTATHPAKCAHCRKHVCVEGAAQRQRIECRRCHRSFRFPQRHLVPRAPRHRVWAIEYHCEHCKPAHEGRFFKAPGPRDLARFSDAAARLARSKGLPIPDDEIAVGDETARLHRWGYQRYRDMFNDRQLLGLGLLLQEIVAVADAVNREALLTVFSDSLRYQNMLCRYDTYALKCQDIFSVHGFPVGLLQCENNLLGIPGIGAGGFRHFVEKYIRAKAYCERPFEVRVESGRKRRVVAPGERIEATLTTASGAARDPRGASLHAGPATDLDLSGLELDGVFTDPPYFDNVQYAELMDFCFVWLRLGLARHHPAFRGTSTRHPDELTGNASMSRDLEHFATGLSAVFQKYAAALKNGAPFVFTYHHNDPLAYAPIVVAVLDAGLDCTATLAAAGEMSASLHIAGTGSSVLDSVFVYRRTAVGAPPLGDFQDTLDRDLAALHSAGVQVTAGDRRCLTAGHIARLVINGLRATWSASAPVAERLRTVSEQTTTTLEVLDVEFAPSPKRRRRLAEVPEVVVDGASV